jgi:hypothetical protein
VIPNKAGSSPSCRQWAAPPSTRQRHCPGGDCEGGNFFSKRRKLSPPYSVHSRRKKEGSALFGRKYRPGYQATHPRRLRSEAHSSLSSTPESAPSMRRAMGALRMQRGPAETAFRPCAIVPGFSQTGTRNPHGIPNDAEGPAARSVGTARSLSRCGSLMQTGEP